ncbi:histidyl-tRNA synthetase [Fluviicoccus keumensis]|uniref:Histidine--tRNA ligase n=1 Tax=Fluviicoccus keumensis TaxID=1435465 RepID=A0A4Q7ZAF4_9GAMM|nr:histidine--tRNA ligase [Fluviicoccus keumensis]RZU47540.1 histidyl-tRNA synthetase [Fluviicoccus keumensis]
MSSRITAIRGMNDILPVPVKDNPITTGRWQQVEQVLRGLMQQYGYGEIRLPVVESTPLFARAIGAVTDIVEKEMYSFMDRGTPPESLTLRPEGTAGCVRACLEHGLTYNQTQRLWYTGPMFRYEKPQKGRYRQFHQFGVETFGMTGPDIDAELILMTARLWKLLGLEGAVQLELNTLGQPNERQKYKEELMKYLSAPEVYTLLDDDSKRRLHSNPLRVLDSKEPQTQFCLDLAPQLVDFLGEESKRHFEELCGTLNANGISFKFNPRLVRGLDYYNKTVFEWTTTALGAQGTVCAGGRYDGLVAQLGGQPTPAVGFAIGLERLVLLLEALIPRTDTAEADIYVVAGDEARHAALLLAETLRNSLPELRIVTHCGGGGFKAQFKKADKLGARVALVLGGDELAAGQVTVKWLQSGEQSTTGRAELAEFLKQGLGASA